MSETPATAEELAALDALTAKAGVAREFFRYGSRTGPLSSQEVLGRTIQIMAGLVPPLTQASPVPPPAPAAPAAELMSDAQKNFLTRLAHQVTGDGRGHVSAFMEFHGGAVTTAAATAEIARLRVLAASGQKTAARAGSRPLVKGPNGMATTNAPVGRYSVSLPGGPGPTLVEITKPTDTKWAGYTFVKTVPFFLGGTAEPVRGALAVHALNAIESDPLGCATGYGVLTGRCGQCNRRLQDTTLGIGPECVNRFGGLG